MITGYELLKYVHVLMAIVTVGFNASYAIWLRRAARAPEHRSFALRGVKLLDDRFANPAYGVLHALRAGWVIERGSCFACKLYAPILARSDRCSGVNAMVATSFTRRGESES